MDVGYGFNVATETVGVVEDGSAEQGEGFEGERMWVGVEVGRDEGVEAAGGPGKGRER